MAAYTTLLTLQVASERLAEFEAMMQVEALLTRAFEGCDGFEIYADPARPGEVLFLEHWRSEQDSRAYGQWRTDRGDMARLGAFFTAPPTTAVLRRVA
ncbi:hypothetical protein BH10PSE5_BH10PSE5_06100 [soil metagenome]